MKPRADTTSVGSDETRPNNVPRTIPKFLSSYVDSEFVLNKAEHHVTHDRVYMYVCPSSQFFYFNDCGNLNIMTFMTNQSYSYLK